MRGRFVNMLSTDTRLEYFAGLQSPYMNTTGMCLELMYQLKSTAVVSKPIILISVVDEERAQIVLEWSNGENRTSWERLAARLPAGLHRIVIEGFRSSTSYCGMSIDDVAVQRCELFGESSCIVFRPVRRQTLSLLNEGCYIFADFLLKRITS